MLTAISPQGRSTHRELPRCPGLYTVSDCNKLCRCFQYTNKPHCKSGSSVYRNTIVRGKKRQKSTKLTRVDMSVTFPHFKILKLLFSQQFFFSFVGRNTTNTEYPEVFLKNLNYYLSIETFAKRPKTLYTVRLVS